MNIILASGSSVRADMLKRAGVVFDVDAAQIDERVIEQPLIDAKFAPADIALVLAEAKALNVAERHPEALIIGADQTLTLFDQEEYHRYHKPADMAAAQSQLLALTGNTHQLHAAVCCVKNGKVLFRYCDSADLTMKKMTAAYIGRYLSQVGESVLSSVGCYHIEGYGVQLFEKIEGDYFTIQGLPLFSLLKFLRDIGEIE